VTARLPFTERSLRRAISAARKSGLYVTGIRPDGTLIVSAVDNSSTAPNQDLDHRQPEATRWGDVQA
jgi:prophage tail gpP-like protein